MTALGLVHIGVLLILLLALARPVGLYLYRVFEGPAPLPRALGRTERALLRLVGTDATCEQTWIQYAVSLLAFSAIGMVVTFAIVRLQHLLPLNPDGMPSVRTDTAFNTAASFTTNTNWQGWSGESTMSHLSQMTALAWQHFVSAATGLAVAVALSRGLTRRLAPDAPRTIGSFWLDLMRATVYVFVPASLVIALVFVSQGVLQNFAPALHVTTLEGAEQVLPMGPVASQEAIKMLGTNGGGFFNANSAHPFENPNPLTDLIQVLCILLVPAGLTIAYGRMAGDQRQGWVLFSAMAVLFVAAVAALGWAESQPNFATLGLSVDETSGNMEGKEVRFGVAASALFATATTGASCGAINAAHDSLNPLSGLVTLVLMKLGEVVFGGVGAGLYGMLINVLLAVFIAGLMVGRTPEYLGKKIEAREMTLAVLYVLVFPTLVLGLGAWAAVDARGTASIANTGPHGLSELLYAATSAAANNGSAFAGLSANTPFWNLTLGVSMLLGRFAMIVPVLAIAGAMVGKKVAPAGLGTFPTTGPLFVGLLIGVIVLVGALTFLPALSLGPIVEHVVGAAGHRFASP